MVVVVCVVVVTILLCFLIDVLLVRLLHRCDEHWLRLCVELLWLAVVVLKMLVHGLSLCVIDLLAVSRFVVVVHISQANLIEDF